MDGEYNIKALQPRLSSLYPHLTGEITSTIHEQYAQEQISSLTDAFRVTTYLSTSRYVGRSMEGCLSVIQRYASQSPVLGTKFHTGKHELIHRYNVRIYGLKHVRGRGKGGAYQVIGECC